VTDPTEPRRRGRPRSERARSAIVRAAGELLLEGGIDAATMEAIAARAQVSKATIYRWWPSRGAVMLDGLFEATRQTLDVPADADVRTALHLQISGMVDMFTATTVGPLVRALAGQAESDPELALALRERWILPRRVIGRRTLEAAIERGELRADADLDVAIDQLFAPVYHRLVFGHEPLHADLAKRIVDQLLVGLQVPGDRP
jgi:AcrR family transcriptional regulator